LDCWQTENYLGARLCARPVGIVMSRRRSLPIGKELL
jgi:hypothetical protein